MFNSEQVMFVCSNTAYLLACWLIILQVHDFTLKLTLQPALLMWLMEIMVSAISGM